MAGTIVCGVTAAAEGPAAAQLAAALASRLQLRLVLVHVVASTRPDLPGHASEQRQEEAERRLRALASALGDDAEVRVVLGSRVDGLARVATDEGADAIVLGSRPRGARGRQLRCSLARDLEAATAVPVVIAPPATRERSGRRLTLAEAATSR